MLAPLQITRRQNRKAANVVITGGSAGLGRATAIEFARQGCNVAVIARDPVRLNEARRDIEAAGGRSLAFPADVADAKAIEAAADTVASGRNCIDVGVTG